MTKQPAPIVPMPEEADRAAAVALDEIFDAELAAASSIQIHIASGDNTEYQRLDLSPELAQVFSDIALEWIGKLKKNRAGFRRYDAGAQLAAHQLEYLDLDLEDHEFVREQTAPLFDGSLKAIKVLDMVDRLVPIANFEKLRADARADIAKLAKVRSISRRPYLKRAQVKMDDIRRVIAEFDLDIDIVVEKGKEKVRYDPKKPWELLRLLDDDYLVSEMTGRSYEATGKRSVRRPPPAGGAKVAQPKDPPPLQGLAAKKVA